MIQMNNKTQKSLSNFLLKISTKNLMTLIHEHLSRNFQFQKLAIIENRKTPCFNKKEALCSKFLLSEKILFLIFLIIISLYTSISALALDDYSDKSSLTLDLSIRNDFSLNAESSRASVKNVKLMLSSFPKTDHRQAVLDINTVPRHVIDNDLMIFYWNDILPGDYSLELVSRIDTSNKIVGVVSKNSFPIKNPDSDLYEYLKPREIIDITPQIKDVASLIASQTDDLYELEYLLAEYVRKNIVYDLSSITEDASQKSSWVLENRVGVCDELTSLFISLNRALGVPSRFVSGVAYTNLDVFDEEWVSHAWAEVYFPEVGWIPFDVSYGQYGFLDAGHIQLADSYDSKTSSIRYEYIGHDIILNPGRISMDVNVISHGPDAQESYDFDISVSDSRVGFGSYDAIIVTISNKMPYYQVADIYLSETEHIKIIEESEEQVLGKALHRKEVLLKPNEQKKIYWIVQIDSDLSGKYIYTLPVSVYNSYNHSRSSNITAMKNQNIVTYEALYGRIGNSNIDDNLGFLSDAKIEFKCSADERVYHSDVLRVDCYADSSYEQDMSGTFCVDEKCSNISIKNGRNVFNYEKKFKSAGLYNIAARISFVDKSVGAGALSGSKAYYLTVDAYDLPKLLISGIDYPKEVGFDDSFNISFSIAQSSHSDPISTRVIIRGPFILKEWSFNSSTMRHFFIAGDGKMMKPGKNNYNITVYYTDIEGNTYTDSRFFIIDSNVNIFEAIYIRMNQLLYWIETKIAVSN